GGQRDQLAAEVEAIGYPVGKAERQASDHRRLCGYAGFLQRGHAAKRPHAPLRLMVISARGHRREHRNDEHCIARSPSQRSSRSIMLRLVACWISQGFIVSAHDASYLSTMPR